MPGNDDYLGYSDEQQKLLYQIKKRFRSKKDIWTYMSNVLVSKAQPYYIEIPSYSKYTFQASKAARSSSCKTSCLTPSLPTPTSRSTG